MRVKRVARELRFQFAPRQGGGGKAPQSVECLRILALFEATPSKLKRSAFRCMKTAPTCTPENIPTEDENIENAALILKRAMGVKERRLPHSDLDSR